MPRPKKYETGAQKAKSIRIRIPQADIDYKYKLREFAKENEISVNEYAWKALKEYIDLQMIEITTQEFNEVLKRAEAELTENFKKIFSPSVSIPPKVFTMRFMETYFNYLLLNLLRLIINSEANIIMKCGLGTKNDIYKKWANELLKNRIISLYDSVDFEKLSNFFENEPFSENSTNNLKLSRVAEKIFEEKDIQFYANEEFTRIAREEYVDLNLMTIIIIMRIFIGYFYLFESSIEQELVESLKKYLETHKSTIQLDEHQVENLKFIVTTFILMKQAEEEFDEKRKELSTTKVVEDFRNFVTNKLGIVFKNH